MKRLFIFAVMFFIAAPVFSQTFQAPSGNQAVVVASCGTAPTGYPTTSGQRAPLVVDTNGNICTTSASGTPSSVNVQQAGGATLNTTAIPGGFATSTVACSGATCYTAPVNSGLVVVASGSTSTVLAATTALDSLHCANIGEGSSVNLTITDGANKYIVGPNFVMPAKSQYDAPAGMIRSIFASGILMSASAANVVNCWVTGKQ